MFTTIGAALTGPTPARTPGGRRPPVRRGSRLAGTCEGACWRPVARAEVRRVVLAAKRYELAGRQTGRARGPLGHVGLEVLELLANIVSFRSGRLEPSLLYLMGKLKRSKAAVVRALASLRAHGFLDWLRRHERVEVVEGPGPRVRQVSNAYRLSLPARAAQLLGHLLSPRPPVPDDVVQEREDRSAYLSAHKASLPLAELPLVEVEDDRLARLLGELGRAVAARAKAQGRAPSRPQLPQEGREAVSSFSAVSERESAGRSETTARD